VESFARAQKVKSWGSACGRPHNISALGRRTFPAVKDAEKSIARELTWRRLRHWRLTDYPRGRKATGQCESRSHVVTDAVTRCLL